MPEEPPDIVLAPGRHRSLRRRHPWVLSGAIERVPSEIAAGDEVRVLSADGEVLGFGHYSPASSLRVRMLGFGKDAAHGDDLLEERIVAALARRADDPELLDTDAMRLINAEGDGLPGLVVDRYGDVVVVKCATPAMHRRREQIAAILRQATAAPSGLLRADAVAARREGFAVDAGLLWGQAPTGCVTIREGARRFEVDPVHGQKTGFYLDQRLARERVAALARGRRVLDVFSYTGGFAVAAACGGASAVTLVDSSGPALEHAARHLATNAPDCPSRLEQVDAFQFLRDCDETYGLLVIDPPPMARQRRDVNRATRAYKDALLHALHRAEPEAWVLAFSCSHHVGPDLFRKVVFAASLDARRPLRVMGSLGAPSDHPVSLDHPEGAYLTGLLLRA